MSENQTALEIVRGWKKDHQLSFPHLETISLENRIREAMIVSREMGIADKNFRMADSFQDMYKTLKIVAVTFGNVDTLTDQEFEKFLQHSADEEESAMWRKVRRAIHKAEEVAK